MLFRIGAQRLCAYPPFSHAVDDLANRRTLFTQTAILFTHIVIDETFAEVGRKAFVLLQDILHHRRHGKSGTRPYLRLVLHHREIGG